METEYSKREIDEFIKEIRDSLVRIEAQTIKTNGRVTKLENKVSWIIGVGSALVFIVTICSNLFSNLIK